MLMYPEGVLYKLSSRLMFCRWNFPPIAGASLRVASLLVHPVLECSILVACKEEL